MQMDKPLFVLPGLAKQSAAQAWKVFSMQGQNESAEVLTGIGRGLNLPFYAAGRFVTLHFQIKMVLEVHPKLGRIAEVTG